MWPSSEPADIGCFAKKLEVAYCTPPPPLRVDGDCMYCMCDVYRSAAVNITGRAAKSHNASRAERSDVKRKPQAYTAPPYTVTLALVYCEFCVL